MSQQSRAQMCLKNIKIAKGWLREPITADEAKEVHAAIAELKLQVEVQSK